MVEIGCCASAGMMPRLTDPLSMTRERVSWNPTEADEPETKPEKPGTPTTDKSGLPDGLGSSRKLATSIETFSTHLRLRTRNSQNLVRYLNPI